MNTKALTVPDISAAAVEAISRAKSEPAWMLELRLKAWRFFEEIPWPIGTTYSPSGTSPTGLSAPRSERGPLLP